MIVADQFIDERFLAPFQGTDINSFPSKTSNNVSMILFGPPGTSKTTIVKAMANKLRWPLVYITPSLFLSKGPDAIDSQATAIFSDLQKLERVIILFDECDELFRKRPSDTTEISFAALITGAMLPRLQDIHDRGRLIFIIATNRLKAIDPAVKRPGRFDYVIPVGPPDNEAIKRLFKAHSVFIPKVYHGPLAKNMVQFTRDEVIQVLKGFDKQFRDGKKPTQKTLVAEIKRMKSNQGLTIDNNTLKVFSGQKKQYPVPNL